MEATIMAPGPHAYMDAATGSIQVLWKREPDIEKACEALKGKVLPVHVAHGATEITGNASNWRMEGGKMRATLESAQGADLPSGSGVSPGFKTREVACEHGTCQTEMVLEHVAASPTLIPRGKTRVDSMEDDKNYEALLQSEADLVQMKARADSLSTEVAEWKAKVATFETAEKERLIGNLKERNDSFEYETLSLDELKKIQAFAEGIKVSVKRGDASANVFATKDDLRGAF